MSYNKELVINGEKYTLAVNISGKGAPTSATEAKPGMWYLDELTGKMYYCESDVDGRYIWKGGATADELSELSNDITDKSSWIKQPQSGKCITITDSTEAALVGLRVFGRTLQNGTPTTDAPVDLVSIGNTGTVKVTVKATLPDANMFDVDIENPYRVSHTVSGTSVKRYGFELLLPSGTYVISTTAETANQNYLYGAVVAENGERISSCNIVANATIYTRIVTIKDGEKLQLYDGIAGNPQYVAVELFAKFPILIKPDGGVVTKTVTVNTPNGLLGIPVNSGGNHVDADCQQWVCDEVDFARDVRVQRIAQVKLADITWSKEEYPKGSGLYRFKSASIGTAITSGTNTGMCTVFVVNTSPLGNNAMDNTIAYYNALGIFVCRADSCNTTTDLIALFNSTNAEWIGILTNPVEEMLSETELAEYAALKTGYPNTTIINDCGAWMEITYKADTKNYIYSEMANIHQMHIENNMVSDGVHNLMDCRVYRNGVESPDNYGQDDAKYTINTPKDYKKIHVFFEYQFTKSADDCASNISSNIPLLTLDGGVMRAVTWQYGMANNDGRLFRDTYVGTYNDGIGGKREPMPPLHFEMHNGDDAFYVKYTGDITAVTNRDVVMVIGDGVCTIKHADTGIVIGSVKYSDDDTVLSLCTSIAALTDVECNALGVVGRTCGELLYNSDLTIPLVYQFTKSDDTSYYDAPRIYVPYAHDTRWHTLEMIFNAENAAGYVAFDGLTTAFEVDASMLIKSTITIGGDSTPIRVRNLVMDYNSYGGAEVVTSNAPPYITDLPQIVSEHNPRLLIYMGHVVTTDTDDNLGKVYQVSTDRLYTLFAALEEKGYKSVSWDEILEWKLNGKALPKRCYTMMLDDSSFGNYLNYDKRKPFNDYGVKPGIAVIGEQQTKGDTINANDTTYTVADAIDIIDRAGWYQCSHTYQHRMITDFPPSESDELFKQDVLACDSLGIHSDVIVYPYGAVAAKDVNAVKHSAFKIGVNVATNGYNCRARANHNFARVTADSTVTLEDALVPIV